MPRLTSFPAFVRVADRVVAIVGGGPAAAAKVRLLGETQARLRVVAAHPEDELRADVARLGATLIEEPFAPRHLDDAVLVFAATEDETADTAIADAARAVRIPVNVVDRPALCDFTTPALVNRAPLAIAIGTEGAAPVLARHVRAKIEAMLAPDLGRLVAFADGLRATVAQMLPAGEARRRFWARAFEGGVAARALAGDLAGARDEALRELSAGADVAGYVWLIGAGPGATDLLTLRAQRVLQEVDVIVHDALVPSEVIAMGRRDAERISVGKRKGHHEATQDEIETILVREAKAGRRVARLKSGDPMVFGRVGEEMAALTRAGVPFEVVPGVTAAFAAAASAKVPLTLRGVASSLVFATGHDLDGRTLPDWSGLALGGATVAVYMGRSVAGAVAERLMEAGLSGHTPVAAVENAARPGERVFAGRLADLPALAHEADAGAPVLILIGEALAQADIGDARPLAAAAVGTTAAA
ncbi:uroporphyrin-III C-methyltransferase/precorrin-2 dehydrogenase/sirohydrochlorin ferrochelatase [Methylopila capsulata]|uniref:Uroporphyrin-III C-methyltransferase n=1 Tax=Methylopila capsulata TaxID=61654 RepID=A0A9W6IQI7_9HYPH|nr:siroheme synthase CysG [Methylopila capsulata]MBM7851603.1 uroporphyrin-III C-methyltransferase/precorrin-2 dehydrogenase/sirohydrochlorin ferrochelatase [Methylopila capsulata]GLK54662.1 uroporphyrin-III C-methyltransferase [Methylopila capsulata]